jgi:hypothetical protein
MLHQCQVSIRVNEMSRMFMSEWILATGESQREGSKHVDILSQGPGANITKLFMVVIYGFL